MICSECKKPIPLHTGKGNQPKTCGLKCRHIRKKRVAREYMRDKREGKPIQIYRSCLSCGGSMLLIGRRGFCSKECEKKRYNFKRKKWTDLDTWTEGQIACGRRDKALEHIERQLNLLKSDRLLHKSPI